MSIPHEGGNETDRRQTEETAIPVALTFSLEGGPEPAISGLAAETHYPEVPCPFPAHR